MAEGESPPVFTLEAVNALLPRLRALMEAQMGRRNEIEQRLEKLATLLGATPNDIRVVWFSKVLQNWKALVSTTLPDGMYYEVTFNGNENKVYLDAYKKFENICISLGQDVPKG